MNIQLKTKPGEKVLELGGGANPMLHPNCDIRQCYDQQGNPTVDFTASFEEPLPIQSDEWDGVFSRFVIEHLSWRKVKGFLAEVYRILKPGGKAVFITADTLAQIKWLNDNPGGWDGKGFYESASEIIFGSQDYEDNTHKNFMCPTVAHELFREAGFTAVTSVSYGERSTDLMIEAIKPANTELFDKLAKQIGIDPGKEHQSEMKDMMESLKQQNRQGQQIITKLKAAAPPEVLFDKVYFNGGTKVGGYANEGYRDFPVHELTARHVLYRQPKSALELGCARGYILKRLQDAGISAVGMEVSKHCYMTRVADGIAHLDICKTPWPRLPMEYDKPTAPDGTDLRFDLCFSIATLEHIPEEHLPAVIKEMVRTCKRGLHGIDFGGKDDGFDQTHCTLRPRQWWIAKFKQHAPGWQVEIVDKEELEQGSFPKEVLEGDGKVKLNIGSSTTMFHHGWTNIDVHDLAGFAQGNGYRYARFDVTQGLPFGTGSVDLIYCGFMLEHLTYAQGKSFLKDCRRVLKQDTGALRILVPDAMLLTALYASHIGRGNLDLEKLGLADFDEINDGCAATPTWAGKYWALLHEGHQAAYDAPTLVDMLIECGFAARQGPFRSNGALDGKFESTHEGLKQILKETLDTLPCLSLTVVAVPSA